MDNADEDNKSDVQEEGDQKDESDSSSDQKVRRLFESSNCLHFLNKCEFIFANDS